MFKIKPGRRPGRVLPVDVVLADALRMYEDSLCPGCHQPAMWAWDIRQSRYFALDPEPPECAACAVLEVAAKDKTSELAPGEKRRVINVMPSLK